MDFLIEVSPVTNKLVSISFMKRKRRSRVRGSSNGRGWNNVWTDFHLFSALVSLKTPGKYGTISKISGLKSRSLKLNMQECRNNNTKVDKNRKKSIINKRRKGI